MLRESKAVTLLKMIVSFAACIAVLELIFFCLNVGRIGLVPLETRTRLSLEPAERPTESMKIPSTVQQKPILHESPLFVPYRPQQESVFSCGQCSPWGESGSPLFHPRVSTRMKRVVRDSGQVVYDVPVSTDSQGRRITFASPREKVGFVAVFGCSYVFGIGVSDGETLPSRIAMSAPEFIVHNYGVPGGSPLEALILLESEGFPQAVSGRSAYGLYLVMYDHIRRVRPSISYGGKVHGPYFEEGPNGDLIRRESYAADHPVPTAIYSLLSRSQVFQYLGLDFPWWYGNAQVRYLAKMLRRMANDWSEKFRNQNFVVVIWPEIGLIGDPLKGYLDEFGVRYLDYGAVPLRKLLKGEAVVSIYDPHPSAEAYAFMGEQIVSDLGL